MNPTRLVCLSSLIAAWLLLPDVARAQTAMPSTPDVKPPVESSVKPRQAALPSTNSEPLRLPTQLERDALVPRIAPAPWMSTVWNDPRYLRLPALYPQQAMAQAPQSPPKDPEMESRFITRRVIGGVLLGLSSPFLVTGGYLIYEFSHLDASGTWGIGYLVQAGGIGLGILSFLGGVALFTPGLILTVTDPSPPEGVSARYRPKVHVGPGSVGLSMSF